MIGILVLLLTNYLSGYFLFRLFFKRVNTFEIVVLPQIFSMVVTPIIFYILYLAAGFDTALYILPLVSLATCFVSLMKKQQVYRENIGKKFLILLFVLFSFFIAMVFINYFLNFSELGDMGSWISISKEIVNSKSLPPDYPCFYGNKVHFQWLYHLMASLISIYSKVDVFYVMPFFGAYLSILFSLICFMIARKYLKEVKIAFFAMSVIAIFFLGRYTDLSYNGYGLIIAMSAIYTFMVYREEKSVKLAFLVGAISSSIIYFHAFSFFFSSLFIISYLLYKIIFGMNKKDMGQILIIILTFVLVLPYILPSMQFTKTFFMFEPFSGLLFNYISTFNILLIALPFGILLMMKNRDEMSLIFLSFLITLFVVLNTFVTTGGPAYGYFLQYMVIPVVMISFNYVKSLSEFKKNLFFVLAVALFLYPYLIYANLSPDKNILMSDEYTASGWISMNTGKNETVLTSDTPLYIALSGRKTIVCQSVSLIGEHVNPKENFADMVMLYTNPSMDLMEKYKISYVVIGDKEKDFFKKYDLTPYNFSSPAFETSYSHGSVKVFKLVDGARLPLKMNENIRNSLNFTSYSRWWQV